MGAWYNEPMGRTRDGQCEHVTMPKTIGRGASGKRCSHAPTWVVTVRHFTGTAVTEEMCSFHAKRADNVVASRKIVRG